MSFSNCLTVILSVLLWEYWPCIRVKAAVLRGYIPSCGKGARSKVLLIHLPKRTLLKHSLLICIFEHKEKKRHWEGQWVGASHHYLLILGAAEMS